MPRTVLLTNFFFIFFSYFNIHAEIKHYSFLWRPWRKTKKKNNKKFFKYFTINGTDILLYWRHIFCQNSDCVGVWKYLRNATVLVAEMCCLDSPSAFLLPNLWWPPCSLWVNHYILGCFSIQFHLFSCSTHMRLHLSVETLPRFSFDLTALRNIIFHCRNSIDSGKVHSCWR